METLTYILCTITCTICLLGALLTGIHAGRNRGRYILCAFMFLWGIFYLQNLIAVFVFHSKWERIDFLAPLFLTSGLLFILITVFYAMEVVRPGWLNLRRSFLILSPYLGAVTIYYAGIGLCGESQRKLLDFSDFANHLSEFNVWFRVVFLLLLVVYLFFLHSIPLRFRKYYVKWCEDNYSQAGKMDASWLRYFSLGILGITAAYLSMILGAQYAGRIFHHLVVEVFFTYLLCKGLFQENPYPEGFFRDRIDRDSLPEVETVALPCKHSELEEKEAEDAFSAMLPTYKSILDEWLRTGKPYLRSDFKLLDLGELLPLNRSYLSRVINEGYKVSFCELVTRFRIDESKRLLLAEPTLPMQDVAKRCGFISLSSFYRSFQKNTGTTPTQYRNMPLPERTG